MNAFTVFLAVPALAVIAWAAVRDRYHSPVQIVLMTAVRLVLAVLVVAVFRLWPGKQSVAVPAPGPQVFVLVDQVSLSSPPLMESLKREVRAFEEGGARVETVLYNWTGKDGGEGDIIPTNGRRMPDLPAALAHVRWSTGEWPVPGVLFISPSPPPRAQTALLGDIPARWIGEPPRPGTVVRSVRRPLSVFAGSGLAVEVRTGPVGRASVLELAVDDEVRTRWTLDRTDATFRSVLDLPSAGGHRVLLRVLGEDRRSLEEYALGVEVLARPGIVQVTGDGRTNELTDHLAASGFQVETASLVDIVTNADGLLSQEGADMVILDSLDPASLGEGTVAALERAVRDRGRKLLYITGSDLKRSARGTPVERILPVRFGREPVGEEGDTVALVSIVDASWSMYFTAAGMGGHRFTPESYLYNKLNMAKKALVNITGALRPQDVFGVLTVRDHPSWVLSPRAGRPPEEAQRMISRIEAAGPGINLYSGLLEAYRELKDLRTDIKHVLVFLDTADVDEYQVSGTGTVWDLVRWYNEAGITISLIGFGKTGDKDITDINRLADLSGGYFYLTTDIKEIPGFSIRDIEQISGTLVDYQARTVNHLSTDMPTVDTLPGIRGQAMTTLKPGARLLAWSDKGYPLAATWLLGEGTAGIFTADGGQFMAADWLTDDRRPWEKLLALILTPPAVSGDVYIQREGSGRTLYVRTAADGPLPGGRWSAGDAGGDLSFTWVSRDLRGARLPETVGGSLIITLDRPPVAGRRGPLSMQVPGRDRDPAPLTLTDWSLEPAAEREEAPAPWSVEREVLILILLLTAFLLAVDELSRPD